MFPKPFRSLKRSISERFLGNKSQPQQPLSLPPKTTSVVTPPAKDDPYRELLHRYDDNVSHLVLHGSSLQSIQSLTSR